MEEFGVSSNVDPNTRILNPCRHGSLLLDINQALSRIRYSDYTNVYDMFSTLIGDNCFNLVGTWSDGNVFDIRILEILVDI